MKRLTLTILPIIFLAAALSAGETVAGCIDWRRVITTAAAEAATARTNGEAWTVTQGSFEMPSGMADEPTVTCYWATPVAKDQKTSPRAQDAVYYFHTPGIKTGSILGNHTCQRLVAESGMTVFGLAFRKTSKSAWFDDPNQRHRYYAFSKSGSFKAILQAWATVRQQLSITRPRFFVIGYSAGGIAAQRFAEEYPESCDGIVTINGHTFVQKRHAVGPALVIHTLGDGGQSEGDGLEKYYRLIKTPCIRLLLSPSWEGLNQGNQDVFHRLNPNCTALTLRFLEALADLRRRQPDGALAPVTTWPLAIAAENPQLVTLIANANDKWQEPFRKQGLTPVPIPSARFYEQMVKMPAPCRRIDMGAQGPLFLGRPALVESPRGLVAIWKSGIQASDEGIAAHISLDLQYAAERRLVAFTTADPTTWPKALAIASAGLPVTAKTLAAILFGPSPEIIASAAAVPGLRQLAVVLDADADDANRFLPTFEKCVARGLHIRVLVSTESQDGYDRFLKPVNPAARAAFFAPFQPKGKDSDLSLHQQALAAAVAFVTSTPAAGK
jgi:hypothetical protein